MIYTTGTPIEKIKPFPLFYNFFYIDGMQFYVICIQSINSICSILLFNKLLIIKKRSRNVFKRKLSQNFSKLGRLSNLHKQKICKTFIEYQSTHLGSDKLVRNVTIWTATRLKDNQFRSCVCYQYNCHPKMMNILIRMFTDHLIT